MTRSRYPRGRKVFRARVLVAAAAVLLAALIAVVYLVGERSDERRSEALGDPIDPAQQTALAFGERSHWLQPWRAYLDTVPAARLRDAIGINFNVEPGEAAATARLLARSGFARARVEIGWGSFTYDDPPKLMDRARVRALLGALKDNRIRPLILLNAHHGLPAPARLFEARLIKPARRGARRLRLDPATARAVVPGRTGLNAPEGKAADVLFTAVAPDGTAKLSKPLPRNLQAGAQPAATLRYAPFGPPLRSNGSRNPAFERTLRGWLDYVAAVTRDARRVLGSDEFDVEIWNELTFGSDFLYVERYYDPPRETGKGDVTEEILDRTVAWLRDPRNGVGGVGIGNGFANQRPWDAGSTSPPGLTAIDKHPAKPVVRFPREAVINGIAPLDARGRPSFVEKAKAGREPVRRDKFIPTYDAVFPEYQLTAIQTEHLIRDLSPITTDIYGTRHGRRTHPPGAKAPTVWLTEMNLDPSGADPSRPGTRGGGGGLKLTRRDVEHLQAKATLRTLAAFVNKGVQAIYFYAVKDRNLALVDPGFFTALGRSRGRYPGEGAGGETPRVVRRFVSALAGAVRMTNTRPLSLLAVSDDHDHKQFDGDGTAAHPPLYNRDVLGFFPYQVTRNRYVVAVYVMTRSLAKLYRPDAPVSDRSRYDLPEETYRLTIGGLRAEGASVDASDPLTGKSVPVKIVSRAGEKLIVELPVTDSPRLLSLNTAE